MIFLKNTVLCLLSVVLLIISYPQIEWWQLAWVALVPLWWVLHGKSLRSAFGWGFLFGFVFFFGTLGWLIYVTYPGTVLLCLYLALYPAIFACGFVYFQKLPLIPRVFVLASLWTVLEFLRANLFTGFGWCTLGHSQYRNLVLIQIADIIGLYGISFLVMLVNLVVFETIKFVGRGRLIIAPTDLKDIRRLQIITLILLAFSFAYGLWTFKHFPYLPTVKVAVVQPNIPQNIKWDERYKPSIVKKTLDLTDMVAKDRPDIILWPETSLPGVLSEQPAFVEQIRLKAIDFKTPIVMGVIVYQGGRYYNSAILIGKDGTIQGQYKKIHLVPFGEFLPLRPMLGWINRFIGMEDFTSGTEYTLFPVLNPVHQFAVLICFEDTINDLWRNFTKAGGEFFMNITNDAWFMDTKEPFLHLQEAVLECVQNKRSLVRAANTGVSGFVDPLGRMIRLAQDSKGKKTFVSATATADVPVNRRQTLYTKYADVFTSVCFLCILWGMGLRRAYA